MVWRKSKLVGQSVSLPVWGLGLHCVCCIIVLSLVKNPEAALGKRPLQESFQGARSIWQEHVVMNKRQKASSSYGSTPSGQNCLAVLCKWECEKAAKCTVAAASVWRDTPVCLPVYCQWQPGMPDAEDGMEHSHPPPTFKPGHVAMPHSRALKAAYKIKHQYR